MKFATTQIATTLFGALLSLLIVPLASVAQEPDFRRFPAFPELPPMPLGAIVEMQTMNSSSRSISMTVENGVKKITGRDDEVRAFIEEQPDGRITIRVTRQYTMDDLDELMEAQPEIYLHLKSIPTETDDAEIEVSVGITKTYEAESAEELETTHSDVFEIYERFTTGGSDDLRHLRELPTILSPERRRAPRDLPPGIEPDDIRIHPDDEKEPSRPRDPDGLSN